MRALVIGHDHVAGVEHVGEQLAARGYELRRWQVVPEQLFADPDVAHAFPDPAGWDLVVTLGAPAVPLPASRIGWYPVSPRVPEVAAGPWFRWHADQLTAPAGAEVLAESTDGVEVFRHGRCVGVQFHPEMTPALLERWLALPEGPPADLDLARLRADTARHSARAAADSRRLLDLVRPAPRG